MNKIYARVVDNLAEAAVLGLVWCEASMTLQETWRFNGVKIEAVLAEALIFRHWFLLALGKDGVTELSFLPAWVNGDRDTEASAENTGVLVTCGLKTYNWDHEQLPDDSWGKDELLALANFLVPGIVTEVQDAERH